MFYVYNMYIYIYYIYARTRVRVLCYLYTYIYVHTALQWVSTHFERRQCITQHERSSHFFRHSGTSYIHRNRAGSRGTTVARGPPYAEGFISPFHYSRSRLFDIAPPSLPVPLPRPSHTHARARTRSTVLSSSRVVSRYTFFFLSSSFSSFSFFFLSFSPHVTARRHRKIRSLPLAQRGEHGSYNKLITRKLIIHTMLLAITTCPPRQGEREKRRAS